MSTHVYALDGALRLTLELRRARFGLAPEDLFQLAVRQNGKRSFLFVSRVLGKHLPIRPQALLSAAKLLALRWLDRPDTGGWAELVRGAPVPFAQVWARLEGTRHTLPPAERTLFLGFAETATGLARAVADCFDGEMAYISTTRLDQPGPAPLTFDESHSHARTHLLRLSPGDPFVSGCRQAVLVDDELTTGNTALRLIRQLHAVFGIRRFTLMALLDNSGGQARRALEDELGVEIRMVSLLEGRIAAVEQGALPGGALADLRGTPGAEAGFIGLPWGPLSDRTLRRAGDLAAQRERCREIARRLGPCPAGGLFLGTGEFIYAPALIAGFCGCGRFHSTTQSPVYPLPGSAVVSGVRFDPPDAYSPAGYLYNVPGDLEGSATILAEGETLRRAGLSQLAAYLLDRGAESVRVCAL